MYKKQLELSTGYKLIEKSQTLPITEASDLLLSEKQYNYFSATNNFDKTATLFYFVLKCPYCEHEVALKHFSSPIDLDVVNFWSTWQLSAFSDNHHILKLSEPKEYNLMYCPNCKKESNKSTTDYLITVEKIKSKIILSHKIVDIGETLQTFWIDKIELNAPFHYYKTLIFNLKNGHTYIKIEDKLKNPVYIRDITQNPTLLKNELISNLISSNQHLRKVLSELFNSLSPLAFSPDEITLEKLVMSTQFVGYEKSFYYTIPFFAKTYKIFPGFKKIAKRVHTSGKVPLLYNQLKLPSHKSTRRIIFSNPGLLFYYREIILLYNAINNVDYFNRVLKLQHIYLILAKINCFPIIAQFISEAIQFDNIGSVINKISTAFESLCTYALNYMSMSESCKKQERKQNRWIQSYNQYSYGYFTSLLPSIIRFIPPKQINNCEIDGYNFEWLITSHDYITASQKMNNCLDITYQPVIVVRSKSNYIAAISFDALNYNKIDCALMCDNRDVHNSAPLCDAIRKWCHKFNIQWDEYDDDTPF